MLVLYTSVYSICQNSIKSLLTSIHTLVLLLKELQTRNEAQSPCLNDIVHIFMMGKCVFKHSMYIN